jgi:amino acid transporter
MVDRTQSRPAQPVAGTDYGELRRNAMGLPSAFAMSVAFISPTIGIVFISALLASVAGAAAPLAFILGSLAMACTAYALAQFAGRIPSAGVLYSSVAKTFGTSTGFVVGVVLMVAYLVVSPLNTDLFGGFISPILKSGLGIDIPWWVLLIFINLVAAVLAWFSVHRSMQFDLALLIGEVLIVGTLMVVAVVHAGSGGQLPHAFTPSASPSGWHGISLAFVFTVFAFFGWESSTTIAEELHLPRRAVPIALIGSVLLAGAWFVFGTYALTVGYGHTHVAALAGATNPVNTLAHKLIGGWYVTLTDLAAISALTGVIIAIHNANFRLLYSLSRERVLPRMLARTHRKYQTPHLAIIAFTIFGIISGLFFGLLWGPVPAFGYLGYFTGLFIAVVYFMADVGIIFYMWRKAHGEFSWLKHGVIPAVGGIIMLFAFYKTVIPLPTGVDRPMPFIFAGIVILSAAAAILIKRRNPEQLSLLGQHVFVESEKALPEALVHEASGEDPITS